MLAPHIRAAAGLKTTLFVVFDARTLGLADGAAVTTWPDGGPHAYNATQSTGTQKPTYRATGLNSQPCVQFVQASSQFLATSPILLSGNYTLYAVASRTATTGLHGIANVDDGGANRVFQFRFSTTNAETIIWNTGGLTAIDQSANDTLPHVISVVRNTSTAQVFVETTSAGAVALSSGTAASGTTALQIGSASAGSATIDGKIGYFAIYSVAHDATTRAGIVSTLRTAWGI